MSIGLIFSAIGAICLAISSLVSNKQKMLAWQLTDYFFTLTANLLLGGYSGAITIAVSIIRNGLMLLKLDNRFTTIILACCQVSLGLTFNNLGWIGLLPIISALSYTIISHLTSKIQVLRLVIIENMLLWFFYDLTIGAYPAMIMDLAIATTSCLALIKHQKQMAKK